MAYYSSPSSFEKYGSDPINVQWKMVRGDTATLDIEFLEADEITAFDCSSWSYKATAYDPNGDVLDEMVVNALDNTVTIIAPASLTLNWGSAYKSVVAELPFDLQVVIEVGSGEGEDTVWTPIVGTIRVLGDITPGGSL